LDFKQFIRAGMQQAMREKNNAPVGHFSK